MFGSVSHKASPHLDSEVIGRAGFNWPWRSQSPLA